MEILQNKGTYTNAFDAAVINNIISQFKDGRVKGWLNELEVFQISSSSIGIKSGYAIIQGRIIVNREDFSINNAVLPSALTLKHIIIRIVIIDELTANIELVNRDYEDLIQENIKQNALGTYEIELARYYVNSNGISNLTLSLPIIPIVNKDDLNNLIGPQGKSAYQIWLDLGNTGSEQDFFNDITGPQGPEGISAVGKSVYDIWLDLGNTGSEQDFINDITGPQGEQGLPGPSITVIDNLLSNDAAAALSARQGKVLKDTLAPKDNPSFTGSVKVPAAQNNDEAVNKEQLLTEINLRLYEDVDLTSNLRLGKMHLVINSGFGNTRINKVAYGGGIWVAVGEEGKLATANDPTSEWTQRVSSFGTAAIKDILYANGIWVAVGAEGKLATAVDPTDEWTQRTTSFGTTDINAIAYGGDVFVIVGGSGKLATSTDPMGEWSQPITVLNGFNINGVAYGRDSTAANLWVIGGAYPQRIAYATNPTGAWTSQVINSLSDTDTILSVSYGGGYWVCGISSTVTKRATYSSYPRNGAGWSTGIGPKYSSYGNGIWAGVNNSGYTYTNYKKDGVLQSWIERETDFLDSLLRTIAYGGGIWVAAGNNGKLLYSLACI